MRYRSKWKAVGIAGLGFALTTLAAFGQATPSQPAAAQPVIRPDYALGPDDQILLRVPQEEALNERPFRVDAEGFLDLPVVGRIRVAGLTVRALEELITNRLREFIVEPTVSITVVQFRNEPIFMVGAFRAPGIYPLQGRRTLVEMLTAAGGLAPNASRRIRVSRRQEYGPIPLPNAIVDEEKKTSYVEVSILALAESINSPDDLILQAYDVVSVERAERVYVSGNVTRPGALELGERDYISVTQAISEAGGFAQFAQVGKVRVLRPVMGTTRRAQLEIDLQRILAGKDNDFPLMPNDVLFVPRADSRAFFVPALQGMAASIPFVLITLAAR
jgi:polysaccharide export outer membrane protein